MCALLGHVGPGQDLHWLPELLLRPVCSSKDQRPPAHTSAVTHWKPAHGTRAGTGHLSPSSQVRCLAESSHSTLTTLSVISILQVRQQRLRKVKKLDLSQKAATQQPQPLFPAAPERPTSPPGLASVLHTPARPRALLPPAASLGCPGLLPLCFASPNTNHCPSFCASEGTVI